MKYIAACLIALCTLPAAAQDTMSAEEFDAYTLGKTLFYGRGGETYGAEIYRENRRVEWSFLDGQCQEGTWYEQDGLICFTYVDIPEPQCWSFERGDRGLIARFENQSDRTELYEAQDQDQEMLCLGPKIGV